MKYYKYSQRYVPLQLAHKIIIVKKSICYKTLIIHLQQFQVAAVAMFWPAASPVVNIMVRYSSEPIV